MMAKNCVARGLALGFVLSLLVIFPASARQAPGQAAGPAAAASPQISGLKIAVINGDRVIAESNVGRQVQAEGQAMQADWQSRLAAKQAELDGLVQQGQEQRLTLNEDALNRLNAQVEQLQIELQRLNDDAQRALQTLGEDAQARINAQLIPAVERMAAEDGYDLILDTRVQGILYFANSIDVTERFIQIVNAGSAGVQQPQQ